MSTTKSASPAVNIVLWVLQVLAAAVFLFACYGKLTSDPMAVAGFESLGQWLRWFTGFAELAGAIGLLVPILSGLASSCLVALMIGATIVTFIQAQAMGALAMVAFPGVTLIVVAIIAYGRRDRTAQLLRLLTGGNKTAAA